MVAPAGRYDNAPRVLQSQTRGAETRSLGPSVWTSCILRPEENSLEGLGGQDS